MNYNEYDSNNKRSFDYSLLFTDKKYRSRLILGIYVLFFIILIVSVRVGLSNNFPEENSSVVSGSSNEESGESVNNGIEDKFEKEFSYIMSNNYNFEFSIVSGVDTYIINGKRFDDKYELILSNGSLFIEYLADGKDVVAFSDGEYSETNLPYYYINYYDNDLLKSILNNATEISDGYYEITNARLFNYVDKSFGSSVNNKDLINTINIELKNNIIVSLEFDITNLVNSMRYDDIDSTKVSLKYSNFNLIDDFEVNL